MEIINGLEHYNNIALGENTSNNNFSSSNVTSNADGSVLERLEWLQVAVGGLGGQLRWQQSATGSVEETDIVRFGVALFDADGGAITSANINITSITQTMERSRDGSAYSPISDPTVSFSKADGIVYMDYEFKAAQWQVGDMYRMSLSGITCTVGGDTTYVPAMIWNNIVVEAEDLTNNTQYLYAVADGGTVYPTEVTDNSILSIIMTKTSGGDTSDFDNSTDSLEAMSDKIGAFSGDGGAAQDDSVKASLDLAHTDLDALISKLATGAGSVQMVATTESLNQAAGDYDLFTGTSQAVVLEGLSVKMPTGAAGGAITSISVQTDDATPAVIISSALGAVANLTSEAELSWTGFVLINVGTKIKLTIAGGAHGSDYTATIVAKYRAVADGGTLAA